MNWRKGQIAGLYYSTCNTYRIWKRAAGWESSVRSDAYGWQPIVGLYSATSATLRDAKANCDYAARRLK